MIVGKFSEFDGGNLLRKWELKIENDRTHDINLSRDVLSILKKKKNIDHLQKIWSTLSDMSHPTSYAQQVPPVSTSDDPVGWMDQSYKNMHYTLDLFFTFLCMNHHLLTAHWGRKTRGWYMGYYKDPSGLWKIEKNLKEKTKNIEKTYFQLNKKHQGPNAELKKIIFQYRQKWSL